MKISRITIGLIIFGHLISGWYAYAQTQYSFRHYDTRDGLGSDESFSIASDSFGYIWISHINGLSRFDGYKFTIFKYEENNPSRNALNLFGNVNLFTDLNGNIWIREETQDMSKPKTLVKYDWRKDRFIKYQFDLKGGWLARIRFVKDSPMIWLAVTSKGLASYNIQTNEVQIFETQNRACKKIRDMKDMGDYLLIATNQGLWKFDKERHLYSRPAVNPMDSATLYNTRLWTFMDNPYGKANEGMWLKLNDGDGLMKISPDLSIIEQVDFPEGVIMQWYTWAPGETIWFKNWAKEGIHLYDTRKKNLTVIESDPSDPFSLNSNDIREVAIDGNGNFWAPTDRGVSCLPLQNQLFENHKVPDLEGSSLFEANGKQFLIVSQARKMLSDRPENVALVKNILIAELNKGSAEDLRFQKINTDQVKGGAVLQFSKGKNFLWVAVAGGGGRVVGLPLNQSTGMVDESPAITFQNEPENSNTIPTFMNNDVWEDPVNGNLWIAHWATGILPGGLSRISSQIEYGLEGSVTKFQHNDNDSSTIISNRPFSFFPQNEKSVWVLTTDEGAYLMHLEDNNQVRFEHVIDQTQAPSTMFRSSSGSLLFGGLSGLFQISQDETTKKWSSSLVVGNIGNIGELLDIQEDGQGRLWFSTFDRLYCYDQSKKTSTYFARQDGIEHMGSIHYARDGRMVVLNHDGYTVLDPLSFQLDTAKITPLITHLVVNNHEPLIATETIDREKYVLQNVISNTSELEFDYQHNNFTLEFSALEMTAPEKNLYKHKLEGYDKEWIETDYRNRTATYTNLPDGTYTFRVKASNHHGVWSDNERTLKVIILPPPWRTWWAYSGYGLIIAGLLFWARKNIVQRERLKSNLKLAQVEQEKEHYELEKAKEVDRVKTSFFTNISHEFRTPLTLIKGPVENLLDRFKDDPEVIQRLKLVQRNSDLLLKLINQLLDLAKLESGSLKVEKTEGDLFTFIRAVASSFESLARQKNVALKVKAPAGGIVALFDKDKLETILINLINNAIKFTPSNGTVEVIVETSTGQHPIPIAIGTNAQPLLLRVKDNGIGIPSDQQSKIFERFHQVSEAHKEVGTGIGLSLVKELIALMGGTIHVKSKVGGGSEFTVILPIETEASGATYVGPETEPQLRSTNNDQPTTEVISSVEHRLSSEEVDSPKPQVLVVEDNADLRSFIIDSLGDEFQYLEAENGRAGLHIATREIPDLIISDVMMPEMDGMEMTQKIKKDIRTSHIPVIMLTAKSNEESKLSGLQSGADDYLTKPFNRQELLLKVRNGVARQQKLREKLRAELMSEGPRVEVMSADEHFLNNVKEKILERLSDEQLSVESLAEDIGMSRVQLYRKVSGLTGIAVNELIRKLRLQKAAQLLEQEWGPVSQVAYEVGFSNLSYFSKVFKEEFGVLPSEYEKT